ncbi:hypothetical protein Plhal304r1_c015g0056931 [Plasmopara halstedii]
MDYRQSSTFPMTSHRNFLFEDKAPDISIILEVPDGKMLPFSDVDAVELRVVRNKSQLVTKRFEQSM